MCENEITMQEAFEDLKKDIESGTPLSNPAYKVRANKPMGKEEFASIRKELDLTQAQLAEILDISIKTVQSYEQGRIEPPGLVAKVLRFLLSNPKFKAIFQGNIDPNDYSDSAELIYAQPPSGMQDISEFMKSVQSAYEKLQTNCQINNMTNSDFVHIQIPKQDEVKNEW